jgi:septation ring formation regulator EzrA
MIKNTKVELENVHREIIETGDITNGRKLERIRNKVDTYNTKVEKAANGYSGIWATVKKEEQELDAVVEFDAKLLDTANDLRKDAENIRNLVGTDINDTIRELERKVDSLIETYEGRELVLKGLQEA